MGVPGRLGGAMPSLGDWSVAKERHRLLKEIAAHGVDGQYLGDDGIATSLFLVRVLTSLRVSSQASRPIRTHLLAMEQFFTSMSHGWHLSRQFMDCGGVRVVVGVLEKAPGPECVRVLRALAKLGRDVKEHICECDAVDVLVRALRNRGKRDMDRVAGFLLVELAFGNPAYEETVRHGLLCLLAEDAPTALRLLAARCMNAAISTDSPDYVPNAAESYPAAFVPSLLALLVAEDAVLAYEATVVFKNLFVAEDLLSPVVAGLVAVLARKDSSGSRAGAGDGPRGNQIFNPTSMCAYATVSTQSLRLCFEISTRAIDPSKNQPNRLRCGRAREV